MHQDIVDGVPVLWLPGNGPLSAGLVFGVGRRDESFLRGGTTHLVEHLAMSALGRTTLDCNASVDLTTTEFTASGDPLRVADFLRRICEALVSLPLERLAVEADVLRTEAGAVASPVVGALLAERYGATGAGLAGFQEPAVLALTADHVRDWARTWFGRGNAAVWLTGPPPAGMSLPLGDGGAPERPRQRVRALATPALVEHAFEGAVGLGAEVPREAALGAMTRILRNRVEDDLRHRRGLSYSVATEQQVVDERNRFVAVTADCREGQEGVIARALWQGATRLADSGATEQELAHDRDELADYLSDDRSRADELRAAAEALVLGLPHRTVEQLRCESAEVTAEQVGSAARALLREPLLGVPFGTEVGLSALAPTASSSGEVVQGEAFRRRPVGSQAPRGARLVVGDDGVSVVLDEKEHRTVHFRDLVALLELGPQDAAVVGIDGAFVPLSRSDWRGGARALELVRAAVPASLQAPADSASTGGHRVLLLHAPPPAASEALWPSRRDAWLAQTPRWTLVFRDQDEEQTYGDAAGFSGVLGRRGAVLLLERAYDELRMVVFHRGKDRAQHVWTGEAQDPTLLAGILGEDPHRLAELLAHDGAPAEVVAALEQGLGVPAQTAPLLAGTAPSGVDGLTHEPARGARASMVAAARGEYDPPDSTKLLHRLNRWERDRPPAYRVANAGAAAVQAALAVVSATRADGDWSSWPGALTALFGVGAVGSLWSTRPPRG